MIPVSVFINELCDLILIDIRLIVVLYVRLFDRLSDDICFRELTSIIVLNNINGFCGLNKL